MQRKPQHFASLLTQFMESVEALKDFSSVVEPVLERRVKKRVATHVRQILPLISPQVDRIELPDQNALEQRVRYLGKNYKDEIKYKVRRNSKKEITGIDIEFSDKDFEKSAHEATARLLKAMNRSNLLRKNSLVSLLGNAEWIFSEALYTYFTKHPEFVTHSSDRTFSYREIIDFGSVDQIAHNLIEQRIRKLVHDSFTDWVSFLNSKLGLNVDVFDEHLHAIKEIFARRNLIVHNGSKVSDSYRAKFGELLTEEDQQENLVHVDTKYFDESAELIEVTFVIILTMLWQHAEPSETADSRHGLLSYTVLKLSKNNNLAARKACEFLLQQDGLSEVDRMYARINYWQSFKWNGEFEEVRKEIEEADFSACDDLIVLARLALLDKHKEFFKLLPAVLKSGKLAIEGLDSWPIFQKIRRTKKYKEKYRT